MEKILTQYVVCALAVALMVPLAQAQPTGIQAAFGKDAGTLSDKFTGLARVMSGKYDWKPGHGVRSVGDVFNLIVRENGMLIGVLSGTPNTGAQPPPITDPEKLQEALKASYVNLEKESWVLMRGIWISAATIARFAVAGSLTLLAGGQSAPKADPPILRATGPATVAGESADRKLVSIAKNVLASDDAVADRAYKRRRSE